jgi:serine protease Do
MMKISISEPKQWPTSLLIFLWLAAASVSYAADASKQNQATQNIAAETPQIPLSNTARVLLDRARPSIVQVRGFFGNSDAEAFHGTGFAIHNSELIVTNYHVVSRVVLYPEKYRLEYRTVGGERGEVRIHAIDVEHDLAVIAAKQNKTLNAPGLQLRTQIPERGERAYSIGFPLSLGLTITEGVSNGLIENALEQRIHFSGALNPGMSGGPALDGTGHVYGVNVATSGQSISYVVPAKHVEALLNRAQAPLDLATARKHVGSQLQEHQSLLFTAFAEQLPTQNTAGFDLPAKLAPFVECNSNGDSDRTESLQLETIRCNSQVAVYVEGNLSAGGIYFEHLVLTNKKLHPLQFAAKHANHQVAAWYASAKHVAPFSCESEVVQLQGFTARVSTCARNYRMFDSLYDIGLIVTSLDNAQNAVVSKLLLSGVDFDDGIGFTRRYLEAMKWNP